MGGVDSPSPGSKALRVGRVQLTPPPLPPHWALWALFTKSRTQALPPPLTFTTLELFIPGRSK